MQRTADERSSEAAVAEWRDISVVIVNHDGRGTVLDAIRSLQALEGVRAQVIVVDDGSADGSAEAIERDFPDVVLHRLPANTRAVNRLRNIGLAAATTDKVFVMDNDIAVDKLCLAEMLRVMDADERVAVCIPRLMYWHEPDVIYMAGGRIHYVGATIAPNRHEPYDGRTQPVAAIGGGIGLFDKRMLARVGGFDEDYALAWGDDAELHQRLLLAGQKVLYVPTAVCFHEYKPFGKQRHYRVRGQVANRWRFILTHYAARTLLLAAPALALYELLQATFLAVKGFPHLYVLGTLDALRALPGMIATRRRVQALRRVPDRELLFADALYVRPEHGAGGRLGRFGVKAVSRLFSLYWRLIRPLLSRAPRPQAALAGEHLV